VIFIDLVMKVVCYAKGNTATKAEIAAISGTITNPLTDGLYAVRKRMKIDEPVIRGWKRY
jgi:hypothetical protein